MVSGFFNPNRANHSKIKVTLIKSNSYLKNSPFCGVFYFPEIPSISSCFFLLPKNLATNLRQIPSDYCTACKCTPCDCPRAA